MAQICSIPDCANQSPRVNLFKIPKDINLRNMWLLSIKQYYPTISVPKNGEMYVCSGHFKNENFILPEKKLLKCFAVPTIFENGGDIYTYIDIYGIFQSSTCQNRHDYEENDSDNSN